MKTSTEQKEKTMSVRLSVSEAAAIQGQAAAENIPVSELIREKVLANADFVSSQTQQKYFRKHIMVAAAFQEVKEALREQGCNIDLEPLERSIYQLCL